MASNSTIYNHFLCLLKKPLAPHGLTQRYPPGTWHFINNMLNVIILIITPPTTKYFSFYQALSFILQIFDLKKKSGLPSTSHYFFNLFLIPLLSFVPTRYLVRGPCKQDQVLGARGEGTPAGSKAEWVPAAAHIKAVGLPGAPLSTRIG